MSEDHKCATLRCDGPLQLSGVSLVTDRKFDSRIEGESWTRFGGTGHPDTLPCSRTSRVCFEPGQAFASRSASSTKACAAAELP